MMGLILFAVFAIVLMIADRFISAVIFNAVHHHYNEKNDLLNERVQRSYAFKHMETITIDNELTGCEFKVCDQYDFTVRDVTQSPSRLWTKKIDLYVN